MNFNRLVANLIFYPTLGWNVLLGRILKVRNWWDKVDENIVLGAMPFTSDVEPLAGLGVRGVVNTCEEYEGPIALYRKHGIEQFRMPTIDFTHPKLSDVEDAVGFMDTQIEAGNRVYVHCKAGRARSATVVICWLIKNRNVTAEEGQKILLDARPHVNPRLPSRPVVKEFEKKWRN